MKSWTSLSSKSAFQKAVLEGDGGTEPVKERRFEKFRQTVGVVEREYRPEEDEGARVQNETAVPSVSTPWS